MRWLLLCVATVVFVALFGCRPGTANRAGQPHIQTTIYFADSCAPCRRYIAAVKKEMPPDGWIVRDDQDPDAGAAHIVITKKSTPRDKIELFPTTIIRRDGKEVDRIVGQVTPDKLAESINRILRGQP